MEAGLLAHLPTVHAERVALIEQLRAEGMEDYAVALESTTYTTVLATELLAAREVSRKGTVPRCFSTVEQRGTVPL